jgi:hypothetical protein
MRSQLSPKRFRQDRLFCAGDEGGDAVEIGAGAFRPCVLSMAVKIRAQMARSAAEAA